MRSYVVFVLILCGTLLALAPIGSDFVQGRQIAEFVSQDVDLSGKPFFRQPLDENYRLASWVLGIAMISLGIIKGWQPADSAQSNRMAAQAY
jgi:hypothetical protein